MFIFMLAVAPSGNNLTTMFERFLGLCIKKTFDTAYRRVRTGRDKEDTDIGVCKTFRGVLRASALALSLMDLSLGPAISSYMTLALPIRKQHS